MKIFLDSASVKDIREAMSWGAIDGITTNPSLIAKEGREFAGLIREICEVVGGPVSAETVSRDAEGMVREGKQLAAVHPDVIVKCPLTKEGLKTTRALSAQQIRVNVTLCFSATQALMAAKAGAYYISPFIGRLDDVSQDGMELIEQIRTIYDNYKFSTQILAASIRHPIHVVQAACIGADIATMPMSVLETLIKHPLTDIGLERFLKDWDTLPPEAKQFTLSAEATASRKSAAKTAGHRS